MKAAQFSQYGGPDVIKVTTEVEKPIPAADQVLVEVKAVSLNPFDTTVREGRVPQMIKSLPITMGGDVAGTIIKVSEGVKDFKVGDDIYGQAAAYSGNSGAFAEFAATKTSQIAKKPAKSDFIEAAALPLAGISALQGLTEHIKLQPGQKILIHGGSGGIGSLAVQIAKSIGAYVATTAPTEALEFTKSLGADEVIDYKTQDFTEIIKDYDAVFDTAGGEVLEKSLGVLKKGGIAVSMIASVDEAKAQEQGVNVISQQTKVTSEKLEALAKLVDDGKVKVHVDKTFPLDQAAEAFKERETGHIKGKIVLTI